MRTHLPHRLAVAAVAVALGVVGLPAGGSAAAHAADHFKRVGYFTQWGIYHGYVVKNVDASGQAAKLTHINYAFANVGADGKCFEANQAGQGDAWADYQRPAPAAEAIDGVADSWGQPLVGNFLQLRKLKAKYPHLKVLLSIGGWTWSKYFSDAALTEQSRQAFVASCVDLFIKGNLPQLPDSPSGGPGVAAGVFDGFDLDWEWPNWPGNAGNVMRPVDRENFTSLLAEFRRQLDTAGRAAGRHYQLTAFLPANPNAIDAGFEAQRIFKYLDFATVQGYDYHGPWEQTTNHQSALTVPAAEPFSPDFTVVSTVDAWLSRGAPRHEIVVGIPYYGHGWTGVPNVNHGLFQTAAGPAPGPAEAGSADYRTLAALPGFTLYRDDEAGFAWLFDGTTFWTLDDAVVVAAKTGYIRRHQLGGAMVWSLDGDDPDATLTTALYAGLNKP
jgi:chitinase